MEKKQFIATAVIVLLVSSVGVYLILTDDSSIVSVELTITSSDNEAVSWGVPEEGFWGEENGAIDWRPLPYTKSYDSFEDGKSRVYTYEYWFRERVFNGTHWEYFNHGPFFVEWPQLEYSKDIPLNNHEIQIRITVVD